MQKVKLWSVASPVAIYVVVSIGMVIFASIKTSQPDTVALQDAITATGIAIHVAGMAAFLIGGYWGALLAEGRPAVERSFFVRQRAFSVWFYGCCVASIVVLVIQIQLSLRLGNYWVQLFQSLAGGVQDPNLRQPILLSHDEGGLPGYIRMFSYAPLAAAMLLVTRDQLNRDSAKVRKHATRHVVLFLTVIVRATLTLDREMAFLYIAILAYGQAFSRDSLKGLAKMVTKPWMIFSLGGVIIAANEISQLRQGVGIFGVIVQYSSLGLANLSAVIRSHFDYTYGLSTFYVLTFVLKTLGLLSILPNFIEPAYVWNPAKYLTAYAFMDFGYFFFLLLGCYGAISGALYVSAKRRPSPTALVLLLAVVTSLLGSISIPPFRGPEWWASLMLALIGAKMSFGTETRIHAQQPALA